MGGGGGGGGETEMVMHQSIPAVKSGTEMALVDGSVQ